MTALKQWFVLFIGPAIVFAVFFALMSIVPAHAGSTVQHDAPTTRFYDSRGNVTGSASSYGNQTKFFDARGNHVGSATTIGGRR
jgi:hypothetical protein